MSEGKDIPIKITTTSDNSGLEKTIGGMEKVKEAAAEVQQSSADRLKGLEKEWDKREKLLEKNLQAIDKEEEAKAQAAEKEKERDEKLSEISLTQKAAMLGKMAGQVGQLGSKFKEAASEVRAFDKDAADALDETGDKIQDASRAAQQLALGFAAGGPLGAGVAALGIGFSTLVNAIKESEIAAIKAAAGQKKAMEESTAATEAAAVAARKRAQELSDKATEEAIKRQNDALAEGLELLNKQMAAARKIRGEKEEVLSAEDDLEIANIELDEASGKIKGPEADKRRAEVSVRAKKRADEERKLQAQEEASKAAKAAASIAEEATVKDRTAAGAQIEAARAKEEAEAAAKAVEFAKKKKALEDAYNAKVEADLRFDTGASSGVIDFATDAVVSSAKVVGYDANAPEKRAADDAVIKAQKEFNKLGIDRSTKALSPEKAEEEATRLAKEAQEKEDLANKRKSEAEAARKAAADAQNNAATIGAESGATINTVDTKAGIEAQARAARERAERIRREQEEKEAAEKQASKDDAAAQKRTSAEAGVGNSALSLLPKGVKDEFRNAVQKAAKGLQDGDQGGEIKELAELMDRLAAAVAVKGSKTEVNLANLQERIKKLESK